MTDTGLPSATLSTPSPGVQAPNAWRVLALLTLANFLNYYDRTIPAVLVEEMKDAFGLNDALIGVMSASFILIYAVAGVWIGRLADRGSRRRIMGVGLIVWSVLTALTGGAWSFASLFVIRLGVGIGEASYAPAANSTIADLFPPSKRSRAAAVFQLGIPLGLILAFFTTGLIVDAFGSWRAPFLIAAVPGLLLGVALMRIDEPARGASEPGPRRGAASKAAVSNLAAVRTVLKVRTMHWLILSGIGLQFAAYSISTFLVPLFQRYYDFTLTEAGIAAGVILGFTGLAGLFIGGIVADRASRKSVRGRVLVGGAALVAAAPISLIALRLGPDSAGLFIALMSLAWLLQFFFHTSALPAVSDVIAPQLRATAIAVFFALFYLLGGAFGPVVTGVLSDAFASADPSAGLSAEANGLHLSLMVVIPASLLLAGLGLLGAGRHVEADNVAMRTDSDC